MERRKFIIGAGALTAGSAAGLGTGAFTSVQANRDVEIDVADDADALLGLSSDDNSNGDYVVENGDGTIALDITDDNGNIIGEGVNEDATTVLRDLFDITNQGANGVFVFINGDDIGFFSDYPANVEYDSEDPVGEPQPGPNEPSTGLAAMGPVEGAGTDGLPGDDDYDFTEGIQANIPARVYLGPGESLQEVGTVIATGDGFGNDAPIDETVTIGAVSVDALGEDVSVNTNVGEEWEVEVDGFDAT